MDISKLQGEELKRYIKLKTAEFGTVKNEMEIGQNYYSGKHDILTKKRTGIGKDGRLYVIENLPNTIWIDNQYKKAVDQKVAYILSERPNIDTKDKAYSEVLNKIFSEKFLRTLSKIAIDTYNTGIGWLFVTMEKGEFVYKKLDPKEIVPLWKDNSHEALDGVIRIYSYEEFKESRIVTHRQYHLVTDSKVIIYEEKDGDLIQTDERPQLDIDGKPYNFGDGKIPFIYFKLPWEKSFVYSIKTLQDGLNLLMSNFGDNMLEDPRNTILVIKNYDGEDLGKFRKELSAYGAVKVTDADGMRGGVDTLKIDVNEQNYTAITDMLKKAIKTNARIIDLEDNKITNPNELTVQALYSDMELDAGALELEYSASFEYLQEFIKQIYHMQSTESAKITFKRKLIVNNESTVDIINKSRGLISEETLIANHPLVKDKDKELARVKKERQETINELSDYKEAGHAPE